MQLVMWKEKGKIVESPLLSVGPFPWSHDEDEYAQLRPLFWNQLYNRVRQVWLR